MAALNLAPGTQYMIAARTRRRRVVVTAIVIAAALVLVWAALLLIQGGIEQDRQEVESRLNTVEADIARLQSDADRIILFESRLATVDTLLDSHLNWNPLLRDIERLLPPPVSLISVLARNDGTLSLQGVTPDIDQVAQTLASLSNRPDTIFTNASFRQVARQEERGPDAQVTSVRYEFTAELSFNAEQLQAAR